ncbi:MAG TPA: glycine oxidase ThiO [Gammaproteobacteria bacterium]|nr:glycine oxidase ThiO [Gammaproteobacteria bacterium]
MSRHSDVIVVGAGIMGLLTARELARGGLSVLLIERSQAGREASRAAAGILSPLYPWQATTPVAALAKWSQDYYPVLADDLRRASGIDPEWTASGLLCFALEQEAAARRWAGASGAAVDVLSADAVHRQEPALATEARPAIFVPGVAQINISRLMRALRETVLNEGIPLREHVPVTSLLKGDGKVLGVRTATGDLYADHVMLCTGAWSAELTAHLGVELPVEPVRGQIIQFDGPPGLVSRMLCEGHHYLLSRRSGQILVGSTRERVGFDKGVTTEALETLTHAAWRLLPLLKGTRPQRQWSGLRPGSAEDVPCIGPFPGMPGLHLNTGHFCNGITQAPAAARLAADLLLARAPILDPAPYRLKG